MERNLEACQVTIYWRITSSRRLLYQKQGGLKGEGRLPGRCQTSPPPHMDTNILHPSVLVGGCPTPPTLSAQPLPPISQIGMEGIAFPGVNAANAA